MEPGGSVKLLVKSKFVPQMLQDS